MVEHTAQSAPEKRRKRDWAPRFLEIFRQTGNVRLSADGAGIDRDTAYRRRQRDRRFAEAWAQTEQDAIDVLEAEARRRALTTSDTLLIFLLKAHRPDRYREPSRVELTGARGGPVALETHPVESLPPSEQAARLRTIAAELDPDAV